MLRDGSPPPPLAQMLQNALADARRLEDSDLAAWQLRSTIGEVLNEQAGTRFIEVGGLPLDFSDSRAARSWRAVDDRIMGGASTSTVRFDEQVGAASFEGELVVEGGGFASVRYSPPFRIPSDVEALELEARGDGRAGYKLTLRSDAVDSSVSYQFQLPPLSGEEFTKLRLPLSEFRATSRGRSVLDAPPLRAADVRSLGLMLSRYESSGGMGKQSIPPGKFRLQIKRIAVAKSELAMNALRWVKPPPGN
eukprot:scaffold315479_cov23-Tisochrysis_lutea.AAC.1